MIFILCIHLCRSLNYTDAIDSSHPFYLCLLISYIVDADLDFVKASAWSSFSSYILEQFLLCLVMATSFPLSAKLYLFKDL